MANEFKIYFVCKCGAHWAPDFGKRHFIDCEVCPDCGTNKEYFDGPITKRWVAGKRKPFSWKHPLGEYEEGHWELAGTAS